MADLYVAGYGAYYANDLSTTGNTYPWTQESSSKDWASVSRTSGGILAIDTDGKLWVVGNNGNGQLGMGATHPVTTWTQIGTDTDWEKVAGCQTASLAIKNGELYVTGYNTAYQLGLGDNTQRTSWTKAGSYTDWDCISIGYNHSLAIRNGNLYGAGEGSSGVFGTGGTTDRQSWTLIDSSGDWVFVWAANQCSYAINSSGELYVTGGNGHGQLGLGDQTIRYTWTQVGTDTDWEKAVGYYSAFAIKSGKLYACGNNSQYQLGLGHDTTPVTTWTQVGTDTDWTDVGCGNYHMVAVKGGTLVVCGKNSFGQLGLSGVTSPITTLTVADDTLFWDSVAASADISSALSVPLYTSTSNFSGELSAYYQSLGGVSGELHFDFQAQGYDKQDFSMPLQVGSYTYSNLSGEYEAYSQSLMSLACDLNTMGPAFEYLTLAMEVAGYSLENFPTNLSAFLLSLGSEGDFKSFMQTIATDYSNLNTDLLAGSNSFDDLPMTIQTVATGRNDISFPQMASLLSLGNDVSLDLQTHRGSITNLGCTFEVSDGYLKQDLSLDLLVIRKSPKFKYYWFQNTAAVVTTASGEA